MRDTGHKKKKSSSSFFEKNRDNVWSFINKSASQKLWTTAFFSLRTTRCIVCFVPLQEKLFRKASEKQTHFCSANCMIKETDEFLLDSYCQMIHQGRSRGQKCYWWGLPLQGQPLTFYLHITGMSCGMRVAHTTNICIWYGMIQHFPITCQYWILFDYLVLMYSSTYLVLLPQKGSPFTRKYFRYF